ncbi:hypothetical protein LINPERPRIM_LOCUS28968 [Linum perenne]
MKRQRSAFV